MCRLPLGRDSIAGIVVAYLVALALQGMSGPVKLLVFFLAGSVLTGVVLWMIVKRHEGTGFMAFAPGVLSGLLTYIGYALVVLWPYIPQMWQGVTLFPR